MICLSFPFVVDTDQNSVVLQPGFVQFFVNIEIHTCSFKDICHLWIHEIAMDPLAHKKSDVFSIVLLTLLMSVSDL